MLFSVHQIEIQTNSSPHHIIFVQTHESGKGIKFHVKRISGREDMVFHREPVDAPGFTSLLTFKSRLVIGNVEEAAVDHFETVCRTVTPPSTQYDTRGICNCLNWVEGAKDALKGDGVLQA